MVPATLAAFGWFDRPLGPDPANLIADAPRVVGGISDDRSDLSTPEAPKQPLADCSIVGLTLGQLQDQQLAGLPAAGVSFCVQSAATATETSPLVRFFFDSPGCRRPVAASGWALTLVESRWSSASSSARSKSSSNSSR